VTAFSVAPVCWADERAALPSESNPIKHNINVFFITILLIVEILQKTNGLSLANECRVNEGVVSRGRKTREEEQQLFT
jgi:hypothetical protein